MYQQTTRAIRVTVEPRFMASKSSPDHGRFFWAYSIEITNTGSEVVQLLSRHWTITDGDGRSEVVDGDGVVGEQPVINPGETYAYSSGCPLPTPSGIMIGRYQMENRRGESFAVAIPAFSLDMPEQNRTLN
jgi:ApaG protein